MPRDFPAEAGGLRGVGGGEQAEVRALHARGAQLAAAEDTLVSERAHSHNIYQFFEDMDAISPPQKYLVLSWTQKCQI